MSISALATVPPDLFTPEDRETARDASRALAQLNGRGCVHVQADAGTEHRQSFVLPAPAVHLLTQILVELAEGRNVSVIRSDAELTTQQAADMLNVSRPYVVKLLEEGKLPFHMANTHRRITLQELLIYKKQRDARSLAAREALVAEAQELDMGY